MRCPKCNASAGNLVLSKEGGSTAVSCRVCGNFQYLDNRGEPKEAHTPKVLCTGCIKNTISKGSEKGLCSKCLAELKAWEKTDQSTPAPFFKVFGLWIKHKT